MTQEEKFLLLKDLSARLTYGVMCSIKGHEEKYWDSNLERYITNSINKPVRIIGISIDKDCIELDSLVISEVYGSDDFGGLKPYLRSISSMTEEEIQELSSLQESAAFKLLNPGYGGLYSNYLHDLIDFMDSNYFDYRTDDEGKTMIEKGLALEAPKGMYK